MKQSWISNIQKYSIHDGKGIRTTVFFKGCPLSCKWCHNPETQRYNPEIMTYLERCVGCGACVKKCPSGAIQLTECGGLQSQSGQKAEKSTAPDQINQQKKAVTDPSLCTACGACLDECIYNAREISGSQMSVEELVAEIEKDTTFYETSGGGVTFSGGEVLTQELNYLEEVMKRLFRKGIRMNIDTCGAVPFKKIERILPYTDTFLYDIKVMKLEKHKEYTGISNEQILENLIRLSNKIAAARESVNRIANDGATGSSGIWIRIPVIGGVNDSKQEMQAIASFLKENKIQFEQINLLPYHNTGSGKYARLNQDYEGKGFAVPSQEKMEQFQQIFQKEGFQSVMIGG